MARIGTSWALSDSSFKFSYSPLSSNIPTVNGFWCVIVCVRAHLKIGRNSGLNAVDKNEDDLICFV